MWPSTGIFSPGRTRSVSFGCTESSGTSCSWPSRTTRAVRGSERQQLSDGAARPPPGLQLQHLPQQHQGHDHRGRLEIDLDLAVVAQWLGQQVGPQNRKQAVGIRGAGADRDQREHVQVVASRSDCHPRRKNGAPAQTTTGVLSTHLQPGAQRGPKPTIDRHAQPSATSPSATRWRPAPRQPKTGGSCRRVRLDPIRRPATPVFGSSAMPQIGQLPGWSCWISGCIGQV